MKKIGLLITVVCLFLFIGPALAAGSASLSFSPASGNYQVGQTFNVTVYVNPSNETIDLVRTEVNFPANLLEVKSFAFSPTFNFPAGGNSYNNTAGTLSYGAGVAGGINQAGPFGTITFRAKAAGEARVVVSADSLVLSAGENKFNGQSSSALFSLSSPATPQPTQSVVSLVSSPTPQELAGSPAKEPTAQESPARTASTETSQPAKSPAVQEPGEGEIVILGTENSEEKSGLSGKVIFGLIVLIILAVIGGLVYKFKNKTQQL